MSVPDYKINYKSDFVLTINGDAGWATQFCIKFWTGMPSQAYFVGFDGVKYVNCRVGDTPTQLLVMFDDHHLPIGPLRMQIAYHTTIEEFPGSVFDEVTNARDVIVTIDGTDYQVMLDFTGEDAPELEFDLPAYANEAERIQNELQRQQNEAARIDAELQREQDTTAAVQGAENVNAQLNGTTLTVTNRLGVSTSVNTKGEQGEQGPVGPEGPQGEQGPQGVQGPKGDKGDKGATGATGPQGPQGIQGPKGETGATGATGATGPQGPTGVSITDFIETGETETDTLYNVVFSNGTTQQVAIPKGAKGDTGEQGPVGPQGPQGPMGDVAVITPEQQAAFTMYSVPGQNTNGPMTQKAVTDALGNIAASSVSYNNSQSGLVAENVQGAVDELSLTDKMMQDCIHLSGGTYKRIVKVINTDFANQAQSFANISKSRLVLNKYAIISTYGITHITVSIPYSTVSANRYIDRASMPLYDKDKNLLSSLDLGWFYFNGSTVTINLDLTNNVYKDVSYIGIYFGCASSTRTLDKDSLDTSNLDIILTYNEVYRSHVADNDNVDSKEYERTITSLDIVEGNYTSYAINQSSRGIFIIDARLFDKWNADISISANSTIKVGIQLWKEYDKSSVVFDSLWLVAGQNYTIGNLFGIKYIAFAFTYISNNNGIPTIGEIHQYITLLFSFTKKGLIERITQLNSPEMIETPYNWREQLTTVAYTGEKINLDNNSYTYELLGTLQSGVSGRQGGASYGNYLFQFHNTLATVCVFDMSTGTNVDKITLTANPNCHAGSGGFSNTFYDNTDPFPLLYISSMDEKKVYVYRITGTVGSLAMTLIQTIILNTSYFLPNIAIDIENNRMVIFAYTKNSWGDAVDNDSVIMYCPIPSYNNDVTISTFEDIFLVPFIYAEQGAFARLGMLYLSYGNTDSTHNEGGIIVIDYVSKTIRNLIGLLAIGSLEPEACVKWDDSIVFTTQSGRVYKLMFN